MNDNLHLIREILEGLKEARKARADQLRSVQSLR